MFPGFIPVSSLLITIYVLLWCSIDHAALNNVEVEENVFSIMVLRWSRVDGQEWSDQVADTQLSAQLHQIDSDLVSWLHHPTMMNGSLYGRV